MSEAPLRPAELAGRWYPADAPGCDAMLAGPAAPAEVEDPVGVIAPHAGWAFSGKLAFRALAPLAEAHPGADLVVVFGGHLSPRDSVRVFLEGAWETPYGPLEIAGDLAQGVAMALSAEPETPEEYYDDNAVEVLCPMIKKLWPNAPVLVVGVPPTDEAGRIGAEVVAQVKARGYAEPVVVGSTDLTHYGPNYAFSPKGRGFAALEWVKQDNDPAIIDPMERLDYAKTVWVAQRQRNACCPGAAAAALVAAKKLGASRGAVTDYSTSFDERPTDPEPTSFVGYVGMLLGR